MISTSDGPPLVCVAGGDGAGKSTQIAELAAALRARDIRPAIVSAWDALSDPIVARRLPFGRRSEVHEYVRVLGPGSRPHFMFHALHVAYERALAKSPDVILLNAYWYKYFATELAHGGDPALLRAWTLGFPPPVRTFYLRISPETALERKSLRSDYESGYGDAAAFVEFQGRSQQVLEELCAEMNWTELDGTLPPEELTNAMITGVEETLSDPSSGVAVASPGDTLLELVDASGSTIGVAEKLSAHQPPGALHRAFSVFLFDDDNRMLLQQRAATKYHSPLVWSNSCCGHPLPGEPPFVAAGRRVYEELGVVPTSLTSAGTVTYYHRDEQSGLVEHEYNHLFVGRIGAVSPDPAEVAAAAYVDLAELTRRRADATFSVWFDTVLDAATPAIERIIGTW